MLTVGAFAIWLVIVIIMHLHHASIMTHHREKHDAEVKKAFDLIVQDESKHTKDTKANMNASVYVESSVKDHVNDINQHFDTDKKKQVAEVMHGNSNLLATQQDERVRQERDITDLTNDMAVYKNFIMDQESKIQNLDELREVIEYSMEMQVNDNSKKVDDVKSKLASTDDAFKLFKDRYLDLHAEHQSNLTNHANARNTLEEDMHAHARDSNIHFKLEDVPTDNTSLHELRAQYSNLQLDLSSMEESNSSLRSEYTALSDYVPPSSLSTLQTEIDELKGILDGSSTDAEDKLERIRESVSSQTNALDNKQEALRLAEEQRDALQGEVSSNQDLLKTTCDALRAASALTHPKMFVGSLYTFMNAEKTKLSVPKITNAEAEGYLHNVDYKLDYPLEDINFPIPKPTNRIKDVDEIDGIYHIMLENQDMYTYNYKTKSYTYHTSKIVSNGLKAIRFLGFSRSTNILYEHETTKKQMVARFSGQSDPDDDLAEKVNVYLEAGYRITHFARFGGKYACIFRLENYGNTQYHLHVTNAQQHGSPLVFRTKKITETSLKSQQTNVNVADQGWNASPYNMTSRLLRLEEQHGISALHLFSTIQKDVAFKIGITKGDETYVFETPENENTNKDRLQEYVEVPSAWIMKAFNIRKLPEWNYQ